MHIHMYMHVHVPVEAASIMYVGGVGGALAVIVHTFCTDCRLNATNNSIYQEWHMSGEAVDYRECLHQLNKIPLQRI